MDGFAVFVMCHLVTGVTFYTTHATFDEIRAANQRLMENGLDVRFIPAASTPEIPLPTAS
jgi:hypothetical protein